MCTGNFASVPNNYGGYQNASTGSAYVGIATYYKSGINYRDIIGSGLASQLNIGTKYYLSMQVNLSIDSFGSSTHASNNLGMLFSTIPYSNTNPAPINNFAHLNYNTVITDTMNWTRVSGSFIADSTYSHIIIGNFFTDANTDTAKVYGGVASDPFAYYFVDDICVSTDSLECYNFSTGIKNIKQNLPINIYPNPASSNFTIEGLNKPYSLTISNSLGQLLYVENNVLETNKKIDIRSFTNGLLFIRIQAEEDVYQKKIIKE